MIIIWRLSINSCKKGCEHSNVWCVTCTCPCPFWDWSMLNTHNHVDSINISIVKKDYRRMMTCRFGQIFWFSRGWSICKDVLIILWNPETVTINKEPDSSFFTPFIIIILVALKATFCFWPHIKARPGWYSFIIKIILYPLPPE